ncbi:RING-type E3 ubiquitin transferase [Ranunculus cassubicifolius]
MAVQAQYPSNVLFLNRNGQEMRNHNNNNTPGNEYSLQTQTAGLLDHQSQMFFNNNNNGNGGVIGVNPRKRGREALYGVNGGNGGSATTTTTTTTPINLFSLQPHPPSQTLINIAQLHHQHHQQQQPNLVSTGLRLAFSDHQQQQQQNILLSSSILSEDLTSQIKQQRDEIDQLLQLQGDQLRRTLAERRQTHYHTLLGVAEATAARRLREKETEIQKASKRNAELEERVAQLSLEAQVWQNKARTQELTATSLQIQLQQAMMANAAAAAQQQEEGVGCSGGNDDAESAHVDPERSNALPFCASPVCKACRGRSASVVLLPCRHLPLCTECNASVDTCPLCRTPVTSSVEVYLS